MEEKEKRRTVCLLLPLKTVFISVILLLIRKIKEFCNVRINQAFEIDKFQAKIQLALLFA